jgi:hypothetical protein
MAMSTRTSRTCSQTPRFLQAHPLSTISPSIRAASLNGVVRRVPAGFPLMTATSRPLETAGPST